MLLLFGMNTYTDKEWGYGNEPESSYAPTARPNPMQWLKAVKAAGMRGGIAVVKHHDGFCRWPTTTTGHSMLFAGNDYGRTTNIPLLFAQAARKLKMKYGFYVRPGTAIAPIMATAQTTMWRGCFCGSVPSWRLRVPDRWDVVRRCQWWRWVLWRVPTHARIDRDIFTSFPTCATGTQDCADCVMWGCRRGPLDRQ
jgi:hypothetical protein